MKKNGFTLIEMIGVIVILGIIIAVAVPNIMGISNSTKANMYCEKVRSIKQAAKLYGTDKYGLKATVDRTEKEKDVTLLKLVDAGYIKKDNEDCKIVLKNNILQLAEGSVACIVDPRDLSSMDNETVNIYSYNKRIFAEFEFSKEDKNLCEGEDSEE